MTIPKITPYSGGVANPDGSQTQTEFTQNMFDQLSYEAELSTELNNTVDGINDTATQVDADATSAAQSAAAAEAAVSGLNYQGLWPDTGGSADKGDTYQTQVSGTPTGQYFTALQNTTVNPIADDVNWREVVSNQSMGGLTNYQAASFADMIAGITIGGETVTHEASQAWITSGYYSSRDGGGAVWDVVFTSSVTPNGISIVECPSNNLLSLAIRITNKTVSIESLGGVGEEEMSFDNSSIIDTAFDIVKPIGGIIQASKIFETSSKRIFDTSSSALEVVLQGVGPRSCGFRYTGDDDEYGTAFQIGVSGVASSGFVSPKSFGFYGNGQTINGLTLYKAQRWMRADNMLVRNFNGMLLTAGKGDVFLNTWGDVLLLNGHRAASLGTEFNANNTSNFVIENCGTSETNTRYDDTVPTFSVAGLGTTVDTISIENCPNKVQLDIEDAVTVNSIYQENNHGLNDGVDARPLVLHGYTPRVLGGNIKLGGFDANESGFYVIDLADSINADVSFRCNLPSDTPTLYQKPILFGTSVGANVDVDWSLLRGVNRRNQFNAWDMPSNAIFKSRNSSFICGMPRREFQRLMLSKYELLGASGRIMYSSGSAERADGATFTNCTSDSKLTRGVGSFGNKFSQLCEQSAAGEFGFSFKFSAGDLSDTDDYLFSSFVSRSHNNALPRIRVLNGTTDLLVEPQNSAFTGVAQLGFTTTLPNASTNNVFFYPLWATDASDSVFAHVAFLINITQIESDFGVDFSSIDINDLLQLIDPTVILDEFKMTHNAVPTIGAFKAGEEIKKHPASSGQPMGWVCASDGDFSGTPPTFLSMADLV